MPWSIEPVPTPNPNAMKFVTDRVIAGSTAATFYTPQAAQNDPTARALFALPGVVGVMLLKEFCTVSKTPEAQWDELIPPVEAILQDQFGK